MLIFPAVDILNGKCVQLVQGKRDSATYFGDPLACAHRWLDLGAERLHVINLDGAFGDSSKNAARIRDLVRETGVEIQLGGGIRSFSDASSWLDTGVERIILGTLATKKPTVLHELSREFGSERIMAGVDTKGGEITTEGWQKREGDYLVWAEQFEHMGAGSLLFTNVDVEGLQAGIDPEPISRLLQRTHLPVTVAGGVSSGDDIRILKDLGSHGAVLGSALYSGKITLQEAMEAAQ
jgi:phosphoribosylformimino-5-aminoimidazole carboxamide ribotide isomerase